jgi:hypothetical protein
LKKHICILFLFFLFANAVAQSDTLLLITKKTDLTKAVQLEPYSFIKCWTKNHKYKGRIERIGNNYFVIEGKIVPCSQIKTLTTLTTFDKIKRIAGGCLAFSCSGPFAFFMINKNKKVYDSFEWEFETVAKASLPDKMEQKSIQQSKNDSINYAVKNKVDSICRHYVKFNASKFFSSEFNVGYEYKFSKDHAFEIEAGYVFPNMFLNVFANAYAGKPSFSYQGINISLGYKTYLKENTSNFYIEPLIGYKYAAFNPLWYYTGGMEAKADYPDVLLSNFKNMVYFSIRSGNIIRKGRKIIEPYAGFGIKAAYNNVHYISYKYSYAQGTVITLDGAPTEKYQPIKHGFILYPFFSIGCKIGMNY